MVDSTEPATKKCGTEKKLKPDTFRSIGKQPRESMESVWMKKRKATVGRCNVWQATTVIAVL